MGGKTDTCWPYELPECAHHVTTPGLKPCNGDSKTPSCKSSCTNKGYKVAFSDDLRKGKSAYNIQGVDAIKKQLVENGPVTAAFTVYDDFVGYKTGVYTPTSGAKELGG